MDRICPLMHGGQLEPLFDPKRQFLAQTKQSGKMLGLFLLLLPGSSQAVCCPLHCLQRGREGEEPERKGEAMLCKGLH